MSVRGFSGSGSGPPRAVDGRGKIPRGRGSAAPSSLPPAAGGSGVGHPRPDAIRNSGSVGDAGVVRMVPKICDVRLRRPCSILPCWGDVLMLGQRVVCGLRLMLENKENDNLSPQPHNLDQEQYLSIRN